MTAKDVSAMIEGPERRVEPSDDTDCGVRLAPLYVVHSAILVIAIVWLALILRG